jgi:neutral ceramidase
MRDGAPTRSLERAASARPAAPSATQAPAPVCTSVISQPGQTYRPGDVAVAEFAVSSGAGGLLPAYFFATDSAGNRVADDGDWSTTIEWVERGKQWLARATWRIPLDTTGTFSLTYQGGPRTDEFAVLE